ncbi:SH3 domain-containing protein [Erythrobacter alti]|uniref:SH3 domain-containing protein n=1 Tax=Erythrobacter alti TaxID=1896145 RepID=UPI0030F48DB3
MIRIILLAIVAVSLTSPNAAAQDAEVPYWASIAAEEANMRVGPGEQYPIDWVYARRGLPVKVILRFQGWRRVQEVDGTEGWIFSGLLSDTRTAIVIGEELAAMRETGAPGAPLRWNLEPGVIGVLGDCVESWCQLDVNGHRGWVAQDRLWGAGEP